MVKKTWAAGKKVAKEMSDAAFKALSNVSDELILYFGLRGDKGDRAQREKEKAQANAQFFNALGEMENPQRIMDFLTQAREMPFRGHITEDKIVFALGQMKQENLVKTLKKIHDFLEKNQVTVLLNWLELLLPDPWERKIERVLGRFVGSDAASGSQRFLEKSRKALGGKDCRLAQLLIESFREAGVYKGEIK